MKRIVKADTEENTSYKEEDLPENLQVIKRLQEHVDDMQDNVYDWQKYLAEAEIGVRDKGGHPANVAYYEKGLHFWEEQLDAAKTNLERAMRLEQENLPDEEESQEETVEFPMKPGEFAIKREDLDGVKFYRKELIDELKKRVDKELGTTTFATLENEPEKFITLAVYNSIGTFIKAHESPPPEEDKKAPTAYDYKVFLESELERRLAGYEDIVQQFSDETDPAHGEAVSAGMAHAATKRFLDFVKEQKGGN